MYDACMSEGGLRESVLALYLKQWELGQPISLTELSRRSPELFGEQVTEDQIHAWSKTNDWKARIAGNLNTSPGLKPIKELFDMWLEIWEESEGASDKATAADQFSKTIQHIPGPFRSAISEQIIAVKDEIHQYQMWYRRQPKFRPSTLGKLTTAEFRLDKSIDIFVEIEHEGINLDMAVLEGR